MPKDDWAKYARRDKGRKALRSGQFDRVAKPKKRKKRKPKKAKTAKSIRYPRSIPNYTSDNMPGFNDRETVVFLRPPYPARHPVPGDCKSH